MVQKVTGFKTEDGKVFDTEALALAHEKGLLLGEAVKVVLVGLGFGDAMVLPASPHDDGSVHLQDFLLDNSEALIIALTPPKRERKARAPKAPAEPSKPLTDALNAVGTTGTVVTEVSARIEQAVVETAPVNVEAGAEVEDELAKLLGGEASTTAEVAV